MTESNTSYKLKRIAPKEVEFYLRGKKIFSVCIDDDKYYFWSEFDRHGNIIWEGRSILDIDDNLFWKNDYGESKKKRVGDIYINKYDNEGNLVKVEDNKGRILYEAKYNEIGLLIYEKGDEEDTLYKAKYNKNNVLVYKKDSKGIWEYNAKGSLIAYAKRPEKKDSFLNSSTGLESWEKYKWDKEEYKEPFTFAETQPTSKNERNFFLKRIDENVVDYYLNKELKYSRDDGTHIKEWTEYNNQGIPIYKNLIFTSFDNQGNTKYDGNTYEEFWKYDKRGNKTYHKWQGGTEEFFEYDASDSLVYYKNVNLPKKFGGEGGYEEYRWESCTYHHPFDFKDDVIDVSDEYDESVDKSKSGVGEIKTVREREGGSFLNKQEEKSSIDEFIEMFFQSTFGKIVALILLILFLLWIFDTFLSPYDGPPLNYPDSYDYQFK